MFNPNTSSISIGILSALPDGTLKVSVEYHDRVYSGTLSPELSQEEKHIRDLTERVIELEAQVREFTQPPTTNDFTPPAE